MSVIISAWNELDNQAKRKRKIAGYFLIRAQRVEDSVQDDVNLMRQQEEAHVVALLAGNGQYLNKVKKKEKVTNRKVKRAFARAMKHRKTSRRLQVSAIIDNMFAGLGRGTAGMYGLRYTQRG